MDDIDYKFWFSVLTLVALLVFGMYSIDIVTNYKMAKIGFCYERVEGTNTQAQWGWRKCAEPKK